MIVQEADFELSKQINAAQAEVHKCLLDNLDTPGAMAALTDLIYHVNLYLAKENSGHKPQPLLLRKAAAYMTRILSGRRCQLRLQGDLQDIGSCIAVSAVSQARIHLFQSLMVDCINLEIDLWKTKIGTVTSGMCM